MKIIILKKPVLIGIMIGILLLIGAGVFLLFWPKEADPADILAQTERADLQNICLLAFLEEEPENKDYWQQLLNNYQASGADPLTIYAAQTEAEKQTGAALEPATERGAFTPGPPLRSTAENGIAPNGKALNKAFYAGAYDGTAVTYLAAEDGLYADYRGMQVRLSPIRADRLLPAENGLYYINTTQHRLQFMAADGGLITTLSAINATDFAFIGEELYILAADGALYCNDTAIELPAPAKRLATIGETLFAALEEGIYSVAEKKLIYNESADQLVSGAEALYFINSEGYPCRLTPEIGEAEVIKSIQAISLDPGDKHLWILRQDNKKIKKIR